jgi:hypothetical protein
MDNLPDDASSKESLVDDLKITGTTIDTSFISLECGMK